MNDDYLPISALQHYAYCPRQFALIHVEQTWAENRFTSEGRLLHKRVDEGVPEQRPCVRYERAVSLISREHRLTGKMDLLEIDSSAGCDRRCYFPVEYKRGKPKLKDWDRIQLCAQALCIEEMRNTTVTKGGIWYWQVRRRETVSIDDSLRASTQTAIAGARAILTSEATPPPVNDPRCRACSLVDLCGPKTFARDRTAAYLEKMYAEPGADGEVSAR